MKKIIISLILLVSLLLTGCFAPASGLVEDTTEKQTGVIGRPDIETEVTFTDYVIHTKNYAFYTGEYYYFFSNYLSEFVNGLSEEKLKEYGFDSSKSLKKQTVKDSEKTWYDFFSELAVSYMTEVLLLAEEAAATDVRYVKAARSYVDEVKSYLTEIAKEQNLTYVQYIYLLYGGNVPSQNYLNALQFDYTAQIFKEDKLAELYASITTEAAERYAATLDGDINLTPSRNIVSVMIDDGKAAGEKLLADFEALDVKSVDALKKLAAAGDYTCEDVNDLLKDTLTANVVSDWLFATDRKVGDSTLIYLENDGYYLLYYCSDGEAQYLLEARRDLAEKAMETYIETLKSKYPVEIDESKLGELNA